MAKISISTQPFKTQAGVRLDHWLRGSWAREFLGAVAWAKSSGLRRIRRALRRFRASGGKSVLIVGVDEGGATVEGLKDAMALVDQVTVFHDTGGRTFHPKVFIVEGIAKAYVLVGSSNLTAGGLFSNYEMSMEIRLNKSKPGDCKLLAELKQAVLHFQTLATAAQTLTPALLSKLLADPSISIPSEKAAKRRAGGAPGAKSSVFGPAVAGLPRAPKLTKKSPAPKAASAPGAAAPAASGASRGVILLAEVPKAGSRWEQANFDLATFTGFFGLSATSTRAIDLQHIPVSGPRGPIEHRPSVSVKSQNYRIELAALKGLAYPTGTQRPFVLVRRVGRSLFHYHALMPGSPGYAQITALVAQHAGPRAGRMRRPQLTVSQVRAAWPQCPL